MYDLVYTNEVKDLIKRIRKHFRDLGYIKKISKYKIPYIASYISEYYIVPRSNKIIEIVLNTTNNTVTSNINYRDEENNLVIKHLQLADLLEL